MQSTTTTIRRLGCTAGLALVGLSVFAGGAVGNSAERLDPSERRALLIRSNALNCKYARAQACLSSAEFRALTIRSAELNRKYGLGSS